MAIRAKADQTHLLGTDDTNLLNIALEFSLAPFLIL